MLLTARAADALACSETILIKLSHELRAQLGPQAITRGLALLEAIDRRYGPAPLRPVRWPAPTGVSDRNSPTARSGIDGGGE